MFRLLAKFSGILLRLKDWISLFPVRSLRIIAHLGDGINHLIVQDYSQVNAQRVLAGIGYWWIEYLLLWLDLLGIGEIYETICDFVKFNTRPLNSWEREMAKEVFGNSINFDRVRIDEYAFIGPPQMNICYVSGYVINSWGKMTNSTLIHELVHVWQYEKIGLVYIPRALSAQRSLANYDYGGLLSLKETKNAGKNIFSYNLEQQAEIVADYYSLSKGYPLRWSRAKYADLSIFEYFVKQVRTTNA